MGYILGIAAGMLQTDIHIDIRRSAVAIENGPNSLYNLQSP